MVWYGMVWHGTNQSLVFIRARNARGQTCHEVEVVHTTLNHFQHFDVRI